MKSLTNNDEQKLLDGVRQAVRYVDDDNMSPNDALTKVSRDLSLLPGQTRAAVSAFNNGRQVAQWKANTPVLDKLAEFRLADYDTIHDAVWGGDEKKANDSYLSLGDEVHDDYSSEPKWVHMRDSQKLAALDIPMRSDVVKEAGDDPHAWSVGKGPRGGPDHEYYWSGKDKDSPGEWKKRKKKASDEVNEHEFRHNSDKRASSAWSTYDMARRTHEDHRSKYAAAQDLLGIRLNVLSNYFKKFAYDRLPFDVVDKAAATYHGANGRALMDIVAERFPKEKRAADTKRHWENPINQNAEPFTFINNAVESAKEVNATKVALDMSKQALDEAKETLSPFSQAPIQSSSREFSPFLIDNDRGQDKVADEQPAGQLPRHDCHGVHPDQTHEEWLESSEKAAAGGLLTGAIIGGGAKPAMEALIGSEGRQRKVQDTEDKLSDPDHENELRKIRAQVMLSEMMSDSENPISGHDPEEVMAAYNELAQLAPRIAEQPAAVQPLLAKRLAGNVEPFEVREIGDIEKSLASTSSPNVMKNDDSIL